MHVSIWKFILVGALFVGFIVCKLVITEIGWASKEEVIKNYVDNTTIIMPKEASNEDVQRNGTDNKAVLIHIPKTGGSSARCMLRMELREDNCRLEEFYIETFKDEALGSGSGFAVRDNTVAMTHNGLLKELDRDGRSDTRKIYHHNDSYINIWAQFNNVIISVRDPVERIVSAFLYTKRFPSWKGGDEVIFGTECNNYTKTTQKFFSNVADGAKLGQMKKTGTECQEAAVKCLKGEKHRELTCGDPFQHGYAYSLIGLLASNNRDGLVNLPLPRIFVIRNEHKWQDFEKTNLILGGSAQSFSPMTLEGIILRKSNDDRSIDDGDRVALCTLLCKELYYHSIILHLAENLHRSEKAEAIDVMNKSCRVADVASLCPSYNFTF